MGGRGRVEGERVQVRIIEGEEVRVGARAGAWMRARMRVRVRRWCTCASIDQVQVYVHVHVYTCVWSTMLRLCGRRAPDGRGDADGLPFEEGAKARVAAEFE